MLPFVSQQIEPQTILIGIDQFDELTFQMHVLFIVDGALEDRILDSLSEIQALSGNVSQAALAGFVSSGDVVGDQNQHSSSSGVR